MSKKSETLIFQKVHRKAQITLFIIIAIIIVALTILAFFYFKPFKPLVELVKPDITKPVYDNLKSCIQEKAIEGLFDIGKQGGYYNISSPFGYYYEISIPFFFRSGKSLLPSLTFLEGEFSQHIINKVNECLTNLSKFEQQGYEIKTDTNKTSMIVHFDERITIKVNYSAMVSKDSTKVLLKPLKLDIDFNFIEKYSLIRQIIEEQEKTPNSLPLLFIMELAKQKRFDFELIDLNDSNYILILLFNTTLKEEPYKIAFLLGYNLTEFSPKTEVNIAPIPEFNITRIEMFEYKINATGKNLSYCAYTDLFNISHTGLIRFNTSVLQNGRTEIMIRVTDFKNENAYAFIIFNVNISESI